jgi:hypothetical protein
MFPGMLLPLMLSLNGLSVPLAVPLVFAPLVLLVLLKNVPLQCVPLNETIDRNGRKLNSEFASFYPKRTTG